MPKPKPMTLWGIWCDEDHPDEEGGHWLSADADDAESDIAGCAAWYTEKAAKDDIRETTIEDDPDEVERARHEHAAPIAKVTMLPPPKTKGKKHAKA